MKTLSGSWKGENSILYRRTIIYPNIPSALRPVEHDCLPIRKPPPQWTLRDDEPSSTSPEDESGSSCSIVEGDFPELTLLHFIWQSELNDLERPPIFRKFRRYSWFLVFRSGICYSKALKCRIGNVSNHCQRFFLKISN